MATKDSKVIPLPVPEQSEEPWATFTSTTDISLTHSLDWCQDNRGLDSRGREKHMIEPDRLGGTEYAFYVADQRAPSISIDALDPEVAKAAVREYVALGYIAIPEGMSTEQSAALAQYRNAPIETAHDTEKVEKGLLPKGDLNLVRNTVAAIIAEQATELGIDPRHSPTYARVMGLADEVPPAANA